MATLTAPPATATTPATAPRHTLTDDAFGILTGAVLVSLGLDFLATSGAATGGTAGVALLLARAFEAPYQLLFALVSLPFVLLAVTRKGWSFTLRSMLSVALVAGLAKLHPLALDLGRIDLLWASLMGNLLVGVGLLVLFRHGSSLGGYGVIALLAQERLGLRAGYVQLCLDAATVLAALLVAPVHTVLISAIGAVVLNLVLAVNHRPGRYLGA